MDLVVERAERLVLQNWKRDGASFVLVRLKCEAIILAAERVDVGVIARVVDRSVATVEGWFRDWRKTRLASVVTGHAGNRNAAKLTTAQKGVVAEALSKPPSESGVPAKFWNVPALKNLISMRFDVEYESESSLHLLMYFAGMSFKYPGPFDRRRDETVIATRMAEIRQQVTDLPGRGYEVFCADEVRVEHEAEIRRMWLPVGRRTSLRSWRGFRGSTRAPRSRPSGITHRGIGPKSSRSFPRWRDLR